MYFQGIGETYINDGGFVVIKAVIFDLQETLLDYNTSLDYFLEDQYERFHKFLIQVQKDDYILYFKEYVKETTIEEAYVRLVSNLQIDNVKARDLTEDYRITFPRFATNYNGTEEVLQSLVNEGYKIGIIAMMDHEHAIYIIDILQLDHFVTQVLTTTDELPFLIEPIMNDLSIENSEGLLVSSHQSLLNKTNLNTLFVNKSIQELTNALKVQKEVNE